MSTVDQRVVEMRFNNAQFEQGAKQSLGTLERLKQALNLSGAAKGLESVGRAAGGIKMDGLGRSVEAVKSRFSALEVMAVTALANITNSAVNAGKQLASSLTVEPISDGFKEYELKLDSVQTIMAGTGASLKEVSSYLDELNTYADRTIYSFSDMTSNIGKFTNAGVGLEDAVKAIQGISNEAAISGANAQQASHAMYNFAQALSSGAVKLIDWKSIEVANMATMDFKQQLIDTAVAMGTLVKEGENYRSTTTNAKGQTSDWFNATKAFNDSLNSQWMTTEVLTQTLANYSNDVRTMSKEEKKAYEEKLRGIGYTEEQVRGIEELGKKAFDSAQDVKTFTQLMDTLKEAVGSGWAQSFETIFGNFDESKALWTGVGNVIGGYIDKASKARNETLKTWKELGGRDDLIASVRNAFNGLLSVTKPIKEAMADVFPPVTGQRLADITKRIREFTSGMRLSGKDMGNLHDTFRGFFSVLDLGKQAVGGLANGLSPLLSTAGSLGSRLLEASGAAGRWLASLDEAAKKGDVFGKAGEGISKALKMASDALGKGTDAAGKFGKSIAGKLSPLKAAGEGIKAFASAIGERLSAAYPVLEKAGAAVKTAFSAIGKAISQFFGGADFGTLVSMANSGVLLALAKSIKGFMDSLKDVKLFDFEGSSIVSGIKEVLGGAKSALEDFQQSLQAKTLITIAGAIGILAVSLKLLSTIDPEKLGSALMGVTGAMANLMGALAIMGKIGGVEGVVKTSASLVLLSAAVLIMSSALKKLSSLDMDELATGLLGIAGLLGELAAVSTVMEKTGTRMAKGSVGLILLAAALDIMAGAAAKLGALDAGTLAKGLGSIGALLAEMAAFSNLVKPDRLLATGLAMDAIAVSIRIMAGALSSIGSLSLETIGKGLLGIGGALAEIAAFSKLADPAGMMAAGASMILISGGLKVMASVMAEIGGMDLASIGKGLLGIGGALAEIAAFTALVPVPNLLAAGPAMLIMAAGIKVLSEAMGTLGGMSGEGIAKSLIAMGGALVIFAAGAAAMQGALPGAAAMLVMGVAVAAFVPALTALGSLSLPTIGKGLLALGGAFAVMGAAGILLAPAVPAVIGMAGALALIGVAVAALGAGVTLAATGLLALGSAITTLAGKSASDLDAFAQNLKSLVKTLVSFVPEVAAAAAEAVTEFAKAIAASAPEIINAAVTIGHEFLKGIRGLFPDVVNTGMELIIQLLDGIGQNIGEITDKATDVIVGFIDGISRNLPRIVDAGWNLVTSFVKAIISKAGEALKAGSEVAGKALEGIKRHAPEWLQKGLEAAGKFISAILSLAPRALSAALQFAGSAIRGLLQKLPEWAKAAADGAGKFISGILGFLGKALSAGMELAAKALSGLRAKVSEWFSIGANAVQGFISGLLSKAQAIISAGAELGRKALSAAKGALGIKSPSKEFKKIGEYAVQGFENGFKDQGKKAEKSVIKALKKVLAVSSKSIKDSSLAEAANLMGGSIAKTVKGKIGKALENNRAAMAAAAKLEKQRKKLEQAQEKKETAKGTIKAAKETLSSDSAAKKQKKAAKAQLADAKKQLEDANRQISAIEGRMAKASDKLSLEAVGVSAQLASAALESVKNTYSGMQAELSVIGDNVKKTAMGIPEAVASYIKNTSSVTEYASKTVKAFRKQYSNTVVPDEKEKLDNSIKNNKKWLKQFRKQKKEQQAILSDSSSTKEQKKKAKEELAVINANIKGYKEAITQLQEQREALTPKNAVGTLAQMLYRESDEYKQTSKNLKSYTKDLEKLEKQRKKLQKEASSLGRLKEKQEKQEDGSEDTKLSKKVQAAEDAQKQLEEVEKKIKETTESIAKETANLAKGPEKALKSFTKSIKNAVKEYTALSNLSLDKSFYGFGRIEKSADLVDEATEAWDMFGVTLKGTAEAVAESTAGMQDAMDILGVSVETGISLLDRFSKVSTTSTKRLLKNAKSQVMAYEEFHEGIAKLRESGLDSGFADELEAMGPEAMGQLRGFLKMSAEEIQEYNGLVAKKAQYEASETQKAMEKQVSSYEQWENDLATLSASSAAGIVDALREAGAGQAAFVHALTQLDEAGLEKVSGMYAKSIGASVTEAVEEGTEEGYSSFLEGVRAKSAEYEKWNTDLAELAAKGLSEKAIEKFREMGTDQSKDYIASILKETAEGIAEINSYYDKAFTKGKSPAEVMLDNLETTARTRQNYFMNLSMIKSRFGFDSEIYKQIKEMGWEAGGEYAEAFLSASEGQQKAIQAMLDSQKRYAAGSLKESLSERMDEVEAWRMDLQVLSEKFSLSDDLMAELIEMGPEAHETVKALTEMTKADLNAFIRTYKESVNKFPDEVSQSVTASYALVATHALNAFKSTLTADENIDSAADSLKKTVSEAASASQDTAAEAGKALGKAASEGTKSEANKEKGKKAGKDVADGVAEGIKERKDNVKEKAVKVGKAAKEGAARHANRENGKKIGKSLADGISNGLKDSTGSASAAGESLGKAVYNATKKSLKINSPSKKFEELARYAILGFAAGMEQNNSLAADAAWEAGDSAYGAFRQSMLKMAAAMDGDPAFLPAITPALDLSGLEADTSMISRTLGVDGSMQVSLSRGATAEVVQAIAAMQADFQAQAGRLAAAIGGMQVVMETGALVGQISAPMDAALGQRMAYNRRGMM